MTERAGSTVVELIAHRAGNSRSAVERFRGLADTIEIDVRRQGRRLMARHARRLWLTSRLWERWYFLPPGTTAKTLAEAIDEIDDVDPDLGVWIDCKTVTRGFPRRAVAIAGDRGRVTVSGKSWWALAAVAGRDGVRVIRSAGNPVELFLLRHLPSRVPLDGVVVKSRLLDRGLVEGLRDRFGALYSWSIPDVETGRRLAGWGVDGLIIDEPEVMQVLRREL